MSEDQQLKLQAFLDGELPEREAREVLAWTQRDAAAAALLAELQNTRRAVSQSEIHLNIPESREFFWSKIERAIRQLEPAQTPAAGASIFFRWHRLLLPAGAFAALAIAGLFAYSMMDTKVVPDDSDAPTVEAMANLDATTYRDRADGTTLVWFSVAADSQSIQTKTPTAIN